LFYRGSVLANLLPVEEATKAGSLSTLPSLKRSLGPSELLFSNHLGIKLPTRTTTQLVSLASITSECLITRKNAKEKKRSKRKSSNEHYKSLSLVTKALYGVGRGFDLFWCALRAVRQPLHQCRWILTVGVLTSGPAWMSGAHRTCTVQCPVRQYGRA
jgi:hypothetical protein